MRIGFDARFYGPEGKGLGRYTQKLLENLALIDNKNEYFVFLRSENFHKFNPPSSNFHKVKADFRWYTLKEQILWPKILKPLNLDFIHFPHFNVSVFVSIPFVVTIHDLILTRYPTLKATTLSPLFYKIKHLGYKYVISKAVKYSQKIITVSYFTKEDLLKHFSISSDKIVVIYEAADPPLKFTLEFKQKTLNKFQIDSPFLLYVGNVYPHKNLEGFLKAFQRLSQIHPSLKLVLVGREDYFYKRLKKEVKKLNLESKVIFCGTVTDEELAVLYSQAQVYVFPSFYEGFGLPALEALSYGLPVAAANTSSLPEILEEAALYFDPFKIHDIVKKVDLVLTHHSLRKKLIKKGFAQIKKFNWLKTARETLAVYEGLNF